MLLSNLVDTVKNMDQIRGMNMKRYGFTIIELMITIGIIATLSAIAMISFGQIQKSARDSQRIQIMTSMQAAMERYYSDHKSYPPTPGFNYGGPNDNVAGFVGLESVLLAQSYIPACLKDADYGNVYLTIDAANCNPGTNITAGGGDLNKGLLFNGHKWTSGWSYSSCGAAPCSSYTLTLFKESGPTVQYKSPN